MVAHRVSRHARPACRKDHLLLGGRVKGGLYGPPPALNSLDGNGNLPFAVDFRDLYATVLDRWWHVDAGRALNGRFAALDLLKA